MVYSQFLSPKKMSIHCFVYKCFFSHSFQTNFFMHRVRERERERDTILFANHLGHCDSFVAKIIVS